MFAIKCLYAVWVLFVCVAKSNGHIRTWNTPHPDTKTPSELMVDVINNLGLNILKMHNVNNENNIALSPYGVASILTALLEGVRGRAALEIQQCGGFPSDKDVIRVGLRDIHRLLRSYFIPQEGFLSGLSLSSEKVTLKPDYQSILRFYGFDMTSFNTPIYPDISTTTSTSNITTTNEPPALTTPDQTTTEATTVQTETSTNTQTETSTNTQTDETTTPVSTTPISTTPIETTTVTEATTPALTTEETAETRIVTQTMLPDTTPVPETTQATSTESVTTPVVLTTVETTTYEVTTEPISTTEAGTTKTVEITSTESTTPEVSTTPFPEDITTLSPVKRSVQTDGTTSTEVQTTTNVVDEFETTTFKLIKRSILDVIKDDQLAPIEEQLGIKLPNSEFSSFLAPTVAATKIADSPLTPLPEQFGTKLPISEISSFTAPTKMEGATVALLIQNLGTKPPNRAINTNLEDNLDAKILNQIERSVNKNSNSTKMADATKNTGANKNIAPYTVNNTGDTINLIETPTKNSYTTKNEENATKNISATTKMANSARNKTDDDINTTNDTKITTKIANTTKNENGATKNTGAAINTANSATNKVSDTKYIVDSSKMLLNITKNTTKLADTTKNIDAAINDANSATNTVSDTKNMVDSSKIVANDTKNATKIADITKNNGDAINDANFATNKLKTLKNATKNMADATLAQLADELGARPLNRTKRSLIDYVIARYYDGRNSDTFLPEESDEKLSFLVSGVYNEKNIHFMTYDVVLPFFYISNLNALALKFPLDSPKYYLLLILPVDEQGIDSLICEIGKTASLKQIVSHMRPTYVRAIIPSFILRGFVILTSSLQKIGIRAIFEPNHADFSPMTGDQNIYVTNIEQAITVMIKNYMDPNMLTKNRNLYQYSPVDFKATHPFLYFVMDSEIDVALVAGKIVNPINSRIQ